LNYSTPDHPFKSSDAKQRYLNFYDKEEQKWPVSAETLIVSGQFGETYVRISGQVDAQPIVLIPGGSVSSLIWTPMIGYLSKLFRVYALDNIYDIGRSVYRRKMTKPIDFMLWLDETFNSLGLEKNIYLAGYSYGGWIVARYALHAPTRVKGIALIAPACTVVQISPEFWFRVFICMIASLFVKGSFNKFMFPWLFPDLFKKMADLGVKKTDEDETSIAFESFKLKNAVLPPILTDKELSSFKVPTFYMIGEHEKAFSPIKFIERLKNKTLGAKVEIVKNAGHDIVMVQPKIVSDKLSTFFKYNEMKRI